MAEATNSLPVKVRKAVPEDVVRIFKLLRRWTEKYRTPFLGNIDEHRGIRWVLDKITGPGFFVVAEIEDGRLVGALGLSWYIPLFSKADDQESAVLDGEFFAVAPGLEGRGVGAAMLRKLRIQVMNAPVTVRLNTCFGDLSSISDELLQKLGFQEVGKIFVLPKPEPEVEQEEADDEVQEQPPNTSDDVVADIPAMAPIH